ncbi:MAG: NAD(P)H-dependent oxidoreductase [Bacteroidales bacterium]|nr:NAD(P)H-dependent oxidoreductase [Bacteroidales bacterium]
MNLTEKLNWRYASKMMNATPIDNQKLENILEAIRLAPTSFGLQPFTVFIVKNQETKEAIFNAAAPGQPQIPTCSHLLIFAAYRKITAQILDDYFELINKTRELPQEKLEAFHDHINGLVTKSDETNFVWASHQAYIALGFGLVAAANEAVDSVPIEGFNHAILDKLLKLEEQNLGSVCLLALGNRDEEKDYNAKLPKVRKPKEKLFVELP